MKELKVTSSAFEANQRIPAKYSCEGPNPPLSISGIPQEAKSLALVLDDPDAPSGTFDHWVVWNIPPSATEIGEDTIPGTEGLNSDGENCYTGPCPPRGKPHRYFFTAYALNVMLDLDAKCTKLDLETAMEGHILARGKLMGLYSR
ncbi:MAG: YbhB/YbcL family Raf kinase inhibitor-like protein [Candidatus Bathyarchaeota archaeon]|nr:YbhB/YbcL family Raf kinase inhibitor-like protein [Candidatus Bathyarchaeota archaeon]